LKGGGKEVFISTRGGGGKRPCGARAEHDVKKCEAKGKTGKRTTQNKNFKKRGKNLHLVGGKGNQSGKYAGGRWKNVGGGGRGKIQKAVRQNF